jgi:predicted HTH domain antitoxin
MDSVRGRRRNGLENMWKRLSHSDGFTFVPVPVPSAMGSERTLACSSARRVQGYNDASGSDDCAGQTVTIGGAVLENDMATVTVSVRESAFSALRRSSEEFAREMRIAAAFQWYHRALISQGKAAEIAGLTRADFLEALFRAKVPACQITVDELKEELESWQRLSGKSIGYARMSDDDLRKFTSGPLGQAPKAGSTCRHARQHRAGPRFSLAVKPIPGSAGTSVRLIYPRDVSFEPFFQSIPDARISCDVFDIPPFWRAQS